MAKNVSGKGHWGPWESDAVDNVVIDPQAIDFGAVADELEKEQAP
jgi:hypothetical protein